MTFPNKNYDFDELSQNSFFIGAYINNECVGLAIVQRAFFKYLYLYDLKVAKACRGLGIAQLLIEKAQEIARQEGYIGLYTQAQDNNLGACLFYLSAGFHIGGLDTKVYQGTPQENKKDIYFYLDNL
ncbi:GNAT family N-acetyltransferase [Vagococcus jeotgali]|uniref:GNAT family N-acetyltransferase n=1 Tax=Vagococcus jeotgali TaxID=3109030 RepID=UPI002DD86061|nr:GNAT family N-acetyltransferase [Vagococcus sp. B2T-5]